MRRRNELRAAGVVVGGLGGLAFLGGGALFLFDRQGPVPLPVEDRSKKKQVEAPVDVSVVPLVSPSEGGVVVRGRVRLGRFTRRRRSRVRQRRRWGRGSAGLTACEVGQQSFPPECGDAFDALLLCYADEPDVCTLDGSECLSEGFALASCLDTGFGGGFDDGSSGSGFGGFSP